MDTCQCGHTDFVELPLLYDDSDEKGRYHSGQVYSRIAYRTQEIQMIYEAWMKVERMSPKRQRNKHFGSVFRALTAEERAAQREKESYDAMTDEEKAWHNAAGRWPQRVLPVLKKEEFTSQKHYDRRFHLRVSLRLMMCTSCGASTIYSNIDEHNRCIDALLPLAQQKIASFMADEKAEEKTKKSSKHERQVAEERVNELKKQLYAAEQAHDSANKRVGDGKKNLSNKNPFR